MGGGDIVIGDGDKGMAMLKGGKKGCMVGKSANKSHLGTEDTNSLRVSSLTEK